MKPLRVGLIGTGRISGIYLENCSAFDEIDIVACGSLDLEESRAKAREHGIDRVLPPEEIIAADGVDAVLNLTIPAAHAEIEMAALDAGKHVYSEKPFVTDLEDGRRVLRLAKRKGLVVGNAPDTFLGGRWQTVRALLDSGVIGRPTGVTALVPTHGVERHHPNPDFYYREGGGPLLDLGPYYLSAMVFLLGPIARVAGMGRRTFPQRMIENGPRNGEMMPVEVDTHCVSVFEFESGVLGQMMVSFDVWDSETPRFEIYGEDGTICIPDPDPCGGANVFGGPVWYRTHAESRWTRQPRPEAPADWLVAENMHGFNHDARGVGLLDMAYAIDEGRPPRASGELAFHVTEVMEAMLKSASSASFVEIASRCRIPDPLPRSFPESNR